MAAPGLDYAAAPPLLLPSTSNHQLMCCALWQWC